MARNEHCLLRSNQASELLADLYKMFWVGFNRSFLVGRDHTEYLQSHDPRTTSEGTLWKPAIVDSHEVAIVYPLS